MSEGPATSPRQRVGHIEPNDRNYLCLKVAQMLIDDYLPKRGRGFANASEAYEWCFNQHVVVTSSLWTVSLFVFKHRCGRINVDHELAHMRSKLNASRINA